MKRTRDVIGYVAAVITVALATAIGWPLVHSTLHLANVNVLMLYLLSVLWVATHHTRGAAVLASALGVVTFDFVFVEPYYTLAVADRQYLVTFGVMLLTALVISALTHRSLLQAELARQRERRTEILFALTKDLAAARSMDEIVAAGLRHTAEVFGHRAVMLLPNGDARLAIKGDSKPTDLFPQPELEAAQRAFQNHYAHGEGSNAHRGIYFPLKGSRDTVGVLGVFSDQPQNDWRLEQRQLAEAFAAQTAVAIERTALMEEARQAWERVETEFLRNTLLSGVSHELRTPLAAIAGAASSLIETGGTLNPQTRSDQLETISSESERMERLINNLLDMTRMESGGLVLKKEWLPLQEVIGSSLHHLERRLRGRDIRIALRPDLPLIQMDGVSIEQALSNLIDNAIEYTPTESPIEITARAGENQIEIEVADRGPGLPAGTEARVFDKFFRIRPGETRRGIGLGFLATVRVALLRHTAERSKRDESHRRRSAEFPDSRCP